jgi:DNA replication protein DnaC
MNTALQRIRLYSKELRMPTLARADAIVRDAQANQWTYEEFLAEVLRTEVAQRKDNQKQRRIKAAKFPLIRTLDGFDFSNLKYLKPETVWNLADGSYIERRGKRHMQWAIRERARLTFSIALGILACNQGYRVRFYSAPMLATELVEARENHTAGKAAKAACQNGLAHS